MLHKRLSCYLGFLLLGLAGCFFLCGVSKANMDCTLTENLRLVKIMAIGDPLEVVVSKLEAGKAEYSFYSKDQKISLADIRTRGYKSLLPLHILVSFSNAPEDKLPSLWFTRVDEILTFVFDKNGRLGNMSCKKFYTAP